MHFVILHGNMNSKKTLEKRETVRRNKSTLEQYSRDLTALAREGKLDPVVGRDEEIRRVIQILSRRTKNNPCLVGEPGVGKTAWWKDWQPGSWREMCLLRCRIREY